MPTASDGATADMTPVARRGSAYGIFNAAYGLCWFAGSTLMGVLYQTSPLRLVLLAVSLQAAALVPLLLSSAGKPRIG